MKWVRCIRRLAALPLSEPLVVTVEKSDDEWKAWWQVQPSLYGVGYSPRDAIDDLRDQIEQTWHELHDGSEYSADWLLVRDLLDRVIGSTS